MPGFQKPHSVKAALKIGLYGPAGSGKTFSSLLIAEGLARNAGKRVAFCDTEQGTAFYALEVSARRVHPQAFDFDVLHTKSITEVLAAIRNLDPAQYGVIVIDSISHLWDSCKNAFNGKPTRQGGIPLHAWGSVKRPYKELLHLLLSTPIHVLICGRQAVDYGADETSGELKNQGFRMRAEGETGYEPDVLLRLESHKAGPKQPAVTLAHVEKDRTGILAGKTIEWPNFDNVAKSLLGLLGATQTALPTDDEVGLMDAETLDREEGERAKRSHELVDTYVTRFRDATVIADLQQIGKTLTPNVKAQFTPPDLERVRRAYGSRQLQLRATPANSTTV